MYNIFYEHLEEIKRRSIIAFPREVCGVIAYNHLNVCGELLFLENRASGISFYEVDAEELYRVLNRNDKKLIFFHSHPIGPPAPSKSDIEGFYPYTYPHLIYSITNNKFCLYEVKENKKWNSSEFNLVKKAMSTKL